VGWSEPDWPIWESLDGQVGSIFGCGRIFMGFGVWFCDLGLEIVIPCYYMIQCRFCA